MLYTWDLYNIISQYYLNKKNQNKTSPGDSL